MMIMITFRMCARQTLSGAVLCWGRFVWFTKIVIVIIMTISATYHYISQLFKFTFKVLQPCGRPSFRKVIENLPCSQFFSTIFFKQKLYCLISFLTMLSGNTMLYRGYQKRYWHKYKFITIITIMMRVDKNFAPQDRRGSSWRAKQSDAICRTSGI